jgi:multidrug efflux system outer membrane protein
MPSAAFRPANPAPKPLRELAMRITWAALDLSRVRARLEAARARAEAQLAFYEKTVLEALEETVGALVELGRARARREHLRAATDSARQAAQLAEQRYQAGVTEYLSVLDAQRTQLTLQDQLAQAETRLATAYVALYKALGGGWEWEALPSDFSGTASSKRPSP